MNEESTTEETPHEKSPGRSEHMRKVNAAGLRGPGGAKPRHGLRALEELLKQGLQEDTEAGGITAFHDDRRLGYLKAFGDESTHTEIEQGVANRLADLDLARLLLVNQRGTRMSGLALVNHIIALHRNATAYIMTVRALRGSPVQGEATPSPASGRIVVYIPDNGRDPVVASKVEPAAVPAVSLPEDETPAQGGR